MMAKGTLQIAYEELVFEKLDLEEKLAAKTEECERLRSFAEWCNSPAFDSRDLSMNATNALKANAFVSG